MHVETYIRPDVKLCIITNRFELVDQFLVELPYVKFYENPLSGCYTRMHIDSRGQTNRLIFRSDVKNTPKTADEKLSLIVL
jgi:hypothetical protein